MESNNEKPGNDAQREAHAHYAAAFIGGFLGLYPIVSAAHIFGSAQTANLIEIVVAAIAGDKRTVAMHVFGASLYCLGILLATLIPKRTRIPLKAAAMAVDSAAAVAMCAIPKGLNPAVYLYPTFLSLSFHWCAFKGGYGYTSSVIFSTNNMRMFVSSVAEILINGDSSFVTKAKFFGATLLSFHAGIAFSYIAWKAIPGWSFLIALVPISVCAFLSRPGHRSGTAG
ncbi:MAG: DUF1275 domain-containing protein [Treponema sp.]|uniref:YoaK family protein n=1 Tax=Treponema sp. TaxID=166 RepID=UPI00257ABB2E|nr:YoaK family protein [Treponema sp.]MBQ5537810.1 DUF1275 domain-containing protein [Treponema sp.]